MSPPVRVAIEGCGHGTLDAIYASITHACVEKKWEGIDLLIIGGDFQAVRNASDLKCMSVPSKYLAMGDFHKYYSGEKLAPYLTIFVGGNHEASNHLRELYYGGWVAPNIYYMGAANVLRLGGLRIAGLSGIWKGFDYKKSHFERLPYNSNDIKSVYHVREVDTRKLLQIRTPVDIGISHDWPRGVELFGNLNELFRRKPFLKSDSESNQLGSVAASLVLKHLRPQHWFAAHLHVRFTALVEHEVKQTAREEPHVDTSTVAPSHGDAGSFQITLPVRNTEEIDLDLEDDENEIESGHGDSKTDNDPSKPAVPNSLPSGRDALEKPDPNVEVRAQLPASFAKPVPPPRQPDPPTDITNDLTRFLALDKCGPEKEFLQLMEIEAGAAIEDAAFSRPLRLSYDPEWLAITRALSKELVLDDSSSFVTRDLGKAQYLPLIDAEKDWVQQHIVEQNKLLIPENFSITADVFDSATGMNMARTPAPQEYTSPQMSTFCDLVGIQNLFHASEEERTARMEAGPRPANQVSHGSFGGRRGGQRFNDRNGGHGGSHFRGRGDGRRFGGRRGRGRGRGRAF